MTSMAIARFPSIVIDCSDPAALARFYGAMVRGTPAIASGTLVGCLAAFAGHVTVVVGG